jgi:hypothetical protein
MPDHRVPAPLETALKQFRDDLAHVNATILALECIEAGGRPSRKQHEPMKSGRFVSSDDSDTMSQKEPANPQADGYAEIHLASLWSPDAEAWDRFMRRVIRLPVWMLPVVQRVIRRRSWRKALCPLEQIRAASNREAARLGLRNEWQISLKREDRF